jgi:hypothetical protein
MSDDQSIFDEVEAVARRSDPSTSWEAAESIPSKRIRRSQAVILNEFREHGPMSDTEVWKRVQHMTSPRFSSSGARTRRSELVRMNPPRLRDSGRRALTESGRFTIIWEIEKELSELPLNMEF